MDQQDLTKIKKAINEFFGSAFDMNTKSTAFIKKEALDEIR